MKRSSQTADKRARNSNDWTAPRPGSLETLYHEIGKHSTGSKGVNLVWDGTARSAQSKGHRAHSNFGASSVRIKFLWYHGFKPLPGLYRFPLTGKGYQG